MMLAESFNDAPGGNTYPGDKFIVVGLGASAGGITALKLFFEHVPPDSGMAYVVILHLSPDHDSKLAEVIRTSAEIPVLQVTERVKVQKNHIYVIPPNQHLEMEDGHINVSPNMRVEDRRAPVDIFFRTLAESHGPNAVCVVLSGTGANGSMGLKRIKERGGAAFVQNPLEAEFNEMPRNSISTDLVDAVLPTAEIPGYIIKYKQNLGLVNIPADAGEKPKEHQNNTLRELFKELRIKTGHDFSNYKRPTLFRRIERRLSLQNMQSLESYVGYMQKNPGETTALLKDLLISVTNFFRDRKAFETLEVDIIPILIKRKKVGEEVRIWVAGCATGEEAYSLAMICAEQTQDLIDSPKVQIFATDIDDDAIAQARDGFYTINDAADVPQERLRRFFSKEGDGYRVRREIREMILFANHNFLKDPPFSHLDLVSCRNVLIYLNRSAQERVMETFHFALNQNSYLFVGSSESVDGGGNLFEIISRDHHIFKRRPAEIRTYPVPESIPAFHVEPAPSVSVEEKPASLLDWGSYGELHQRLLEQYAPPSLVINEEYDIVHLSENAVVYLQFSAGEPSQNLLRVVRRELRIELRAAIYQAVQQKTAVATKELKVKIGDRLETIAIQIRPALSDNNPAQSFILVIFEKKGDAAANNEVIVLSEESGSRFLEEELMKVKTQLRGSNEKHEFQEEELKASNEELQALNEELRSAAEELETSKEELQSMNEELRTVNQELKVKIDETSINSNNLQNLINSTSIGTIFLDRSFRIAMFTPSVRDIFNLIPTDHGRPLSDITHRLQYNGIIQDAEKVMEKLAIVEHEVTATDARIFIMRLLPYRTSEDHINGVVITFIDITKRKEAEKSLQQSQEIYRTVLSSIDEGFCIMEILSDDGGKAFGAKYVDANEAFFQQTGLSKNILGSSVQRDNSSIEFGDLNIFARVAQTGKPERIEFEFGKAHNKKWFDAYAMRIAEPVKNQVAVFYNNITDHKYRELNAAFLVNINDDFTRLASSDEIVNAVVDKLIKYFNVSWATFVEIDEAHGKVFHLNQNHSPEHLQSLNTRELSDYANDQWLALQKAGQMIVINDITADSRTAGSVKEYEQQKIGAQLIAPFARSGKLFFVITLYSAEPYNWRKDQIELLQELAPRIYQRIERVRAEDELQKSDERLKKAFSIETVGVIFFKPESEITGANDAFLKMTGYSRDSLQNGQVRWKDLTPEESQPEWLKVVEQFLVYGRTIPYEKQYLRKNGTYLWALVSVTRISEDEAVEFIIDITEQKLSQQQKDEFIAIASHELKTPVTSIKVYAEVLQEKFEKANDQKNAELLGKLDGQLERLAKLINDLLDTTKISEGKLMLDVEEFDINNLIKEHVEELKRISQKHQLIFRPSSLPLIAADKHRIGQVLVNLVSNAIKYSPDGGEIRIISEAVNDGIRITVKDKGIGIPASLKENVFQRFFRVTNPKIQTYPGMGLGLYISAAIVKRHGGSIDVESKENEGSAFSFFLPFNNPA